MTYHNTTVTRDCVALVDKVGVDSLAEFSDSTVVITGANGLIGGFLADLFVTLNDVHGFRTRIFLSSRSTRSEAYRLQHVLDRSDVTYLSRDLAVQAPVSLPQDSKFLFYCAGYGQPKKFMSDKLSTVMINTVGLDATLGALSRCQPDDKRAVYISSSEVYGSPTVVPTPESYSGTLSSDNNRACYIGSKVLGEMVCQDRSTSSMLVKSARLALAYGPGVMSTDDRVLQNFVVGGHRRGKIVLQDSGSAVRNYLYIRDCAEKLLNIVLRGKHGIYNVGGDTEQVTIRDLAEIVGKVLGVPVEVPATSDSDNKATQHAPEKVGLDMSRYNSEFGTEKNPVTLASGVGSLVDWFGYRGAR